MVIHIAHALVDSVAKKTDLNTEDSEHLDEGLHQHKGVADTTDSSSDSEHKSWKNLRSSLQLERFNKIAGGGTTWV